MKLENEVCRRVYDHHDVLKNEFSTALFESLTQAKLPKEVIAQVVATTAAAVDTSSERLVSDYQRLFKTVG